MSTATKPAARPRQLSYEERCARFPLDFTVDDQGDVLVPQSWRAANLRQIIIPTVGGGQIAMVHRHALPVFDAWLGLLSQHGADKEILTFDGSYAPRLKRGVDLPTGNAPSKNTWGKLLSNHSRGTAIDLNAVWNRMGKPGAAAGERGSLDRVIWFARQVCVQVETPAGTVWNAGIVCGADWSLKSRDDMHFEIGVWP